MPLSALLEQTGMKPATFYRRLREFRAERKGATKNIAGAETSENIHASQTVTEISQDTERIGEPECAPLHAPDKCMCSAQGQGRAHRSAAKKPRLFSETFETRQPDAVSVVNDATRVENLENNHVLPALADISDCATDSSRTNVAIKKPHDNCRKRRECDQLALLPLPIPTDLKQPYLQAFA